MAKFVVAENVVHYHEVEIDDELDMLDIIDEAQELTGKSYTGYEALEEVLRKYRDKFGLDYEVKPNFCGTLSLNISLED